MPAKRKAADSSGAAPKQKKQKKPKKDDTDAFTKLCDEGEAKLEKMAIEEAVEVFGRALAIRPQHTETLDLLAELCIGLGRIEEAHKYLMRSAEVAPEEAHGKYMYLGQMAESKDALGFYEKGLGILKKQFEECEDEEDKVDYAFDLCSACCSMAELYLTDLCFEADAEKQCEKWLDECKQFDARFPEMYQMLGSLRWSQHRPDDAKAALRKCVDLQQELEDEHTDDDHLPSIHSQVELCKLLLEVNDLEYCKLMLFHVLDADDSNPYLWYLLGQCYREEKRPTTAYKCFSRAKKHSQGKDIPEVVSDIEECLKKLSEESAKELEGVDATADLTDDEDEEEEEQAEGEAEE